MTYSFSYLEPVCCSISSSNCCFLTCIQISQESSQVVWFSHLLKNFPQFIVMHTVKGFGIVNKAEIDVFLELPCSYPMPEARSGGQEDLTHTRGQGPWRCQVYLCTSCTLINLCKSPIPAPPCFCAFAHSPPTPRASPILLLARGSGMDRGHLVFWNQQGVPLKRPSPPPSQSCLVHYPSG